MTNMFSRLFVRYTSRKKFSFPAVSFKYVQREVEVVGEKSLPLNYPYRTDYAEREVEEAREKHLSPIHHNKYGKRGFESEAKQHLPPMYPIEEDRQEKIRIKDEFRNGKFKGYDKSKAKPSHITAFHDFRNDALPAKSKNRKIVKLEGKYKNINTSRKRMTGRCFEPFGEMIFGIHSVFLALQAQRRKFHHLYFKAGLEDKNVKIQEILKLADAHNLQVEAVDLSQLAEIIGEDRVHQGVCCDASSLHFENIEAGMFNKIGSPSSEEIDKENSCQLWLYLDRIQDPMNFGAILRSAYFMGVDKVITSKNNSCRLTGVVSKASAGAAEILPVYQTDDLKRLLQTLLSQGWNLVSTAPECKSSVPLSSYMPSGNTIVAVGSEGYGISPDLQDLFKTTLAIQPGRTLGVGMDSLNVSVAAAVILHDIASKISSINDMST